MLEVFCAFYLAYFFLLFAPVFHLLKEKVAMLIIDFNALPRKVHEQYDQERMSANQKRSF